MVGVASWWCQTAPSGKLYRPYIACASWSPPTEVHTHVLRHYSYRRGSQLRLDLLDAKFWGYLWELRECHLHWLVWRSGGVLVTSSTYNAMITCYCMFPLNWLKSGLTVCTYNRSKVWRTVLAGNEIETVECRSDFSSRTRWSNKYINLTDIHYSNIMRVNVLNYIYTFCPRVCMGGPSVYFRLCRNSCCLCQCWHLLGRWQFVHIYKRLRPHWRSGWQSELD